MDKWLQEFCMYICVTKASCTSVYKRQLEERDMTETLDKKEEGWLVHGFPVELQKSNSQPCVETNESALR